MRFECKLRDKQDPEGEITRLLRIWRQGARADRSLFETVYRELRRLARIFMRSERETHSLAPSDLVHEAYLRLKGRRRTRWRDRRHFFAVASQCMRRILIEHARRHLRPKHGSGSEHLHLDEAPALARQRAPELAALDDALQGLVKVDPFKARLVELRFFGGFSIAETAAILRCSRATVERHWRLAQAWLYAEMRARRGAEGE